MRPRLLCVVGGEQGRFGEHDRAVRSIDRGGGLSSAVSHLGAAGSDRSALIRPPETWTDLETDVVLNE